MAIDLVKEDSTRMPNTPQEKKCKEDCVANHRVEEFAELQDVHPSTVWRWKRRGMPYRKHTRRIPCKEAREWLLEIAKAA
jgi:hypothetical protein